MKELTEFIHYLIEETFELTKVKSSLSSSRQIVQDNTQNKRNVVLKYNFTMQVNTGHTSTTSQSI